MSRLFAAQRLTSAGRASREAISSCCLFSRGVLLAPGKWSSGVRGRLRPEASSPRRSTLFASRMQHVRFSGGTDMHLEPHALFWSRAAVAIAHQSNIVAVTCAHRSTQQHGNPHSACVLHAQPRCKVRTHPPSAAVCSLKTTGFRQSCDVSNRAGGQITSRHKPAHGMQDPRRPRSAAPRITIMQSAAAPAATCGGPLQQDAKQLTQLLLQLSRLQVRSPPLAPRTLFKPRTTEPRKRVTRNAF